LFLQELRTVVQVRRAGSKGGRVLLRPGLHLRPRLHVSCRPWLREREEGAPVSVAHASASPTPAAPAPAERARSRELLVRLAAHRPAFLAFVQRRVRSVADAEDLLQQALLKASAKLDSLRDGERVEAWFYRVLRNTIADHRAAWARREASLALLAREASEAPPEEAAACACSLGVLARIPDDYAAIVRRIDLDEESLGDVAAALGITPNNAKVRLHRARKALRGALLSYCETDAVRACQSCAC
jgi:RNA polymerase sigma-70 factor (ECF subfamily)